LVNGNELRRKLQRLGRERGVEVRFDQERGKGSHGTLYFGDRRTTLKDRRAEIRPGLLHAMLSQLGLTERDLR
jgi:mRNA interferase HicA